MNYLAVSIVTVPTDQAKAFIAQKTFEPDANLSPVDKPPKSITEIKGDVLREKRLKEWIFAQGLKLEQSVMLKRQSAIETAGRRWWTGKVIAISFKEAGQDPIAMVNPKEKLLLTKAFELLTDKYPRHSLIGKGGRDFHLPFLTGRGMAYDLGLPPHLISNYPMPDIHEIFGRSAQSTQRGTMEDYAFGMGLRLSERESPQYLFDQYQLGNEQALVEIQHRCNEEVVVVSTMMDRYYKRFPLKPTATQKGEIKAEDIPF